MLWDKSSRRLEKLVQMIPRKAGRQEIRWKDARKGRLRALIFNTFIIFCPLCTMYMQCSQNSNYTLTNLYLILPRYLQWHLASYLPSTPKCRAQCWETHPWSTKLWAQDRLWWHGWIFHCQKCCLSEERRVKSFCSGQDNSPNPRVLCRDHQARVLKYWLNIYQLIILSILINW